MRFTLMLAALFVSNAAFAADVTVESPWVRGTVAGQRTTGAFMVITSKKDAALVGVSSKVAAVTEVHEMKMEDDRMLMRQMERLELPAGKPVELARGGYHIMLMDLKRQLKAGEFITLKLKIENSAKKIETISVKAKVRDLTAAVDPHAGHHH